MADELYIDEELTPEEHFKDKANKDWKNMKKNSKRKDGKYGEEE